MFPTLDITLMTAVGVGLAAYLLGSVPFGMILARIMGLGNLRDIGSGNLTSPKEPTIPKTPLTTRKNTIRIS